MAAEGSARALVILQGDVAPLASLRVSSAGANGEWFPDVPPAKRISLGVAGARGDRIVQPVVRPTVDGQDRGTIAGRRVLSARYGPGR